MKRITDIINKDHFSIDIVFKNFWNIAFGVAFGVNSFRGDKLDNFYFEIEFLFWIIGLEIKNFHKEGGKQCT